MWTSRSVPRRGARAVRRRTILFRGLLFSRSRSRFAAVELSRVTLRGQTQGCGFLRRRGEDLLQLAEQLPRLFHLLGGRSELGILAGRSGGRRLISRLIEVGLGVLELVAERIQIESQGLALNEPIAILRGDRFKTQAAF